MKTNRRDFIKMGAGSIALATVGCTTDPASREITKKIFAGLEELPTVMPNAVVRDGALKGKCVAKYVDDCIWFLRDIAKDRPKSIFDNPYLGGFKKIHDATGLKVQFNLFYRTDFFYGMDEFTLADMPTDYKAEFKANADWIKFGLHSLQEFPDYLTMAHAKAVTGDNKYVYDPDTGMRFRGVCTAPMSCLNLQPMKDVPRDLDAVKGLPFIGYGNHEQYFYKDYLAHQPDYMEKEMLVARTFKERGYKFVFMEEMG